MFSYCCVDRGPEVGDRGRCGMSVVSLFNKIKVALYGELVYFGEITLSFSFYHPLSMRIIIL